MELDKLAEIHFDTNEGYLTMVDPLHVSTIDTDAILADPSLCDKMIANHVAGCRQIAWNQQYVSIVSDKVSGIGIPLENAIISFPNNKALLCLPQVAASVGVYRPR